VDALLIAAIMLAGKLHGHVGINGVHGAGVDVRFASLELDEDFVGPGIAQGRTGRFAGSWQLQTIAKPGHP
jgi:hypothetical protein